MFKLEESRKTDSEQVDCPRKVSSETAASQLQELGCQTHQTGWKTVEDLLVFSDDDAQGDLEHRDVDIKASSGSPGEFPCSECGAIISMHILEDHMNQCPSVPVQKQTELAWEPCLQSSRSASGIFDENYQQHMGTNQDILNFSGLEDNESNLQQPSEPAIYIPEIIDQPMVLPTVDPPAPNLSSLQEEPPITVGPHFHFQFGDNHMEFPPESEPMNGVWIRMEFAGDITATMFVLSDSNLSGAEVSQLQNLITLIQSRMQPPPNLGLNEAEIGALPRLQYSKLSSEPISECCTICMNEFKEDDKLVRLPCRHCFDEECLVPWLQSNSSCPNCRSNVRG